MMSVCPQVNRELAGSRDQEPLTVTWQCQQNAWRQNLPLMFSRAGAAVTRTLVLPHPHLSNTQRHLLSRYPQVWTRVKGVMGMKLAVGGGGFLTQGLADPSSAGDSTPAPPGDLG